MSRHAKAVAAIYVAFGRGDIADTHQHWLALGG